ncbi:MAG: site-specific DNA-methyltransferase [Pirellulaceae bacterium]|nr:site-specific DNA-methyltransferase [Pirellulaceae bacterium]
MSLKQNEIHQGDCIALLKQVKAGTVDLVFADPPFNIGYEYDVYDDRRVSSDFIKWCKQWIQGVYRALKPTGTFWLAIGDEYAAELKIEAQKAGFYCRSWVIWYYTFGVNCVNGFSRSHTHLFHFVKDPSRFTFNRPNPQIRVKSARQLVYADNRANPNGRLPDNTWITRPQDAPDSFSPQHDTWYFARVAGTFKEREGFHGCQMPEQLLARIIMASSRPQDLVLDPFGGSGTTLCVAKKLGRRWMGFELSEDYVKYIKQRLDNTALGDAVDGPVDPIESSPSTAQGKQRKKPFGEDTEKAVCEAYRSLGYPADYLICHKELNRDFIGKCLKKGIGGNAYLWNRYLLTLRKAGKLPPATNRPNQLAADKLSLYSFASEVAWRLLAIDYQKTLDDILCSPEFAEEFDRLAREFGPTDVDVSSLEYRLAALSIRKRSHAARESAVQKFSNWISHRRSLEETKLGTNSLGVLEQPGVFLLCADDIGFFAGESDNMRVQIERVLENEKWASLEASSVKYVPLDESLSQQYALKSALAIREHPLLNCRLLMQNTELARKSK